MLGFAYLAMGAKITLFRLWTVVFSFTDSGSQLLLSVLPCSYATPDATGVQTNDGTACNEGGGFCFLPERKGSAI